MQQMRKMMDEVINKYEIEEGIDLEETPIYFVWFYKDKPEYKFELMIKKLPLEKLKEELLEEGFNYEEMISSQQVH
jgi:hypothetical protein